jgi:Trk-type K+ transport system membrane component
MLGGARHDSTAAMEPLEFPLEFFKTLRAEWATVSAHPEAFATTFIFGLVFGWIAAWLILKQRLDHHKELVEYYKDVVSDKMPGNPSVSLSQLNRQWRLSWPLLLIGALFILVGIILAYSISDPLRELPAILLILIGLMMIVFAVALVFPIKPPDKQ